MRKCMIKLISTLFACWIFFTIVLYLNLMEIGKLKYVFEIYNKLENNHSLILNPIRFNNSKKLVVISIDLNKVYHMFLLPYLTLAWRRVNYEPIFLFVIENENQYLTNKKLRQLQKTTEVLNLLNVTILKIPSNEKYAFMIPMIIRLFSGILPDNLVNDDDFILTSDADLIPINKNFYFYTNKTYIKIWNAFCCEAFEFKSKYY